ncbi:alpha-rhamnosidase [Catenovulum maritimum]|uniref:alpha-L-rhamnosidase n=1 Tax=Catenovulum maritimum TaxID=1513271 RepID=A0A0J8GUX4_9ALTE|nr:alpha-rhamnosidase [Catenovulum maritimum]
MSATQQQAASNLLVEGHPKPLNVHRLTPRLSWHANVQQQAAYQIQAASSTEQLLSGQADLWDSGKVLQRRSLNISYQGKPLTTNQNIYWRVRVWAKGSQVAQQWSDIQHWQMGLLTNSDWQAKWLQVQNPVTTALTPEVKQWIKFAGTTESVEGGHLTRAVQQLEKQATASLFRHQFRIDKVIASAKLHSTAGGYYEIFVNGRQVKDRLLDPGQTDFDKRILYNSDDVSALLENGNNSIAVHLGSGWYNEEIAFSGPKRKLSYGQPTFIAQLDVTFTDGSTQQIITNEEWRSHPSAIVKEGIFSGEFYDANQAVPDWNAINKPANYADWQPVKVLQQWPTEVLEPQLLPPVRAQQSIKPVKILNPKPDVWVFDFGQNFTGIPTLDLAVLNLTAKQAVYLRYAEWADSAGNISQLSSGGWATKLNAVDAYLASATPQNFSSEPSATKNNWTAKFTWRGFRYVEITGLKNPPNLDVISARLVRSDVKRVGHFESSDPLLNRIHQTALWSYESNLISLPLDCPNREKAGWTGDAHATLITGNYNFNMDTFWQKYLGDFKTARHIAPAVVPGKRTTGKKLDWAVAEVFIAWEHYRHHGDQQLLAEQYQSLLEYMDFGESQLSNYLLKKGYGDWCDPVVAPGTPRVKGRGVPQHTSTTVTSSALFARAADLMSRIAKTLAKPADEQRFARLFENIRSHFHQILFNEKTGHYGSQTADAMALRFNLTPEHLKQGVADALNHDVSETWRGHSSVGALGQTWLYRALSDYGHADTAFHIFKAKGYPGFSYLFDEINGTTLWERKGSFDPALGKAPDRSLNHPFHGGYDGWFYEGLGGIRPLDNSVGYQDFALAPVFPKALSAVSVSHVTGYGEIKSEWQRYGDLIHWQVSIPQNSTAEITLPGGKRQLYLGGQYSFEIKLADESPDSKGI